MNKEELLEALILKASSLHFVQLGLVLGVAKILQSPVVAYRRPNSDLATEDFLVALGNRLLLHHAFTYAPLTKKHIEHALEAAVNESGGEANVEANATSKGHDITLNGKKVSLKTEAAAGISDNEITISKLSEARWIQQCDTLAELVARVQANIPTQLGYVDRILMLRYFKRAEDLVTYQLVELPLDILLSVVNVPERDYRARTAQGGSSVNVQHAGQTAFTLRLDGSDGKLTVSGLRLSLCVVHATWSFDPRVSPTAD